jgi:hypothetical protein
VDEGGRVRDADRARAIDYLTIELPYHLHVGFLSSLIAATLGDGDGARGGYARAAAAGRRLLRQGGFATELDVLELTWDEVILEAARLRVRAARN